MSIFTKVAMNVPEQMVGHRRVRAEFAFSANRIEVVFEVEDRFFEHDGT